MSGTRLESWRWPVFVAGMTALAAGGLALPRKSAAASAPAAGGLADVNGTQLYYEEAGAGEPLVLIHGMGADCRV